MNMFEEQLNKQNESIAQEILGVREEIDRADDQGLQRYDLRKKLLNLQGQLEQNEKLLQKFGPEKSAVNL